MDEWDSIPTTDEWIEATAGMCTLGDLVVPADEGLRAFIASQPPAWFVFGGTTADLRRPGYPASQAPPAVRPALHHPNRDLLTFPIVNTPRSPYSHFVSVGRAGNNDIHLPDDSVAGFHAAITQEGEQLFLKPGPEVRLSPLKLNGAPVSLADSRGVPLRSGDIVTVGEIELAFLDASALFVLVQKLG